MDVTSLLNSSSVAAEQQKRHGERFVLPSRNRTPWDANGYSLPINTSNHTINIGELGTVNELSTVNPKIHCYESHGTDSERSPHHKFSDSRSSLSSFTSTTNSSTTSYSTHSRFSSLSTSSSNSNYPISFSHRYCNSSVENSTDLSCSPYSSHTPRNKIESRSAPTSPHNKPGIMVSSPTENLDALAALAEQEASRSPENKGARSESITVAAPVETTDSLKESESPRPGSPSDAMLIRRPDLPRLNTDTSDNELESDQ